MLILERLLKLIFGDDEDPVVRQSFNVQTKSPQKFYPELWEERFSGAILSDSFDSEISGPEWLSAIESEWFESEILANDFSAEVLSFAAEIEAVILTEDTVSIGQKFNAVYLKSNFDVSVEADDFNSNINTLDEFSCKVDTRI